MDRGMGYVLRIYDHIRLATTEKQVEALDKCTHQELSNLVYLMILFPEDYSPGTRNLISHFLKIRFNSFKLPFVLNKNCEQQVNKLKDKGYVRNRLYENGEDIIVNGKEIGEII
jgi:hypothetical protein